MDASEARLLHLVLFSAMRFRAEASFRVNCVTFSSHDFGRPRLLASSTVPCMIVFARGSRRMMWANWLWPHQVQLGPLDDADERFLLVYEFINLSFNIFVCFSLPVCYAKDFSV